MKKVLISIMMICALMMGVSAFDGTVIVGDQPIVFSLTPDTLDFGSLTPGNTDNATAPIVFSVTSGNVASVTIAVTDVTGDTVLDGIEVTEDNGLNWGPISALTGTIPCVEVGGLCTYPSSKTWVARLFIPLGTPANTYTQAITYTINGVAPSS